MKSLLLTVSLLMASLFGALHPSTVFPTAPFSSAVATIAPAEASTVLSAPHLFPLAAASSGRPALAPTSADITQGIVLGTSTASIGYVTQDELTTALTQATNALRSLIYQNESAPNSLPATGGYTNNIALSNAVDQLNGTTLTNVTVNGVSGLTASEIPSLASTYLPLTGGTLTGTLIDSSNIGIGTTTPTNTLSVNGSLGVSSTSSLATLGAERISDGSFSTNPSGTWTLGTGWSWDSSNSRASYTGTGGPIASIAIDDGGSGYSSGDTITISGGSGDATYTANVSSGRVTGLTLVSAGTTYTSGTGISTTGGTGTGLKVSITQIANSANTVSQNITTSPSDPITSYTLPGGSGNTTWTGTPYRVAFTIANYSGAGQIQVNFGQNSGYYSSNGTYTLTLISTSSVVTLTPTGDFVGEITNVSAKPITPLAALATFTNSDGSAGPEIRSGGALKWNTFIGAGAGSNYPSKSIADEGFDTALGYNALYSNTGGDIDTAIGFDTLFSNTTGGNNTAVGGSSMYNNTTGGSNTALGYGTLLTNTTGGQNVALGYQSMFLNTTGSANTATGAFSLKGNTTGTDNTADGWSALGSNRTASQDSAFGYQSLTANTTGGSNTASGYLSLSANTIGGNNTAMGAQALLRNTTGSNDVAVGIQTLRNATSTIQNTALGALAMQGGSTGSLTISGTNNVAVGYQTLQNYIDGSSNTALGTNAMLNATTSSNNVAVGYQAGRGSSTNDSYQGLAALGYQAGLNLANGSSYNTLIGFQAGYNITTGSNNIIVATATSSTGVQNLTTGSQNILIGNNISFPSATANGQLDIGNEIYGTNIVGTGSTLSTGNIGIGSSSPLADLTIQHNYGGANSTIFNIASSTNSGGTAATNFLIVTNTGNVGIGTTTPYSRLQITGPDTASTSAFTVVNSASTTLFAVYDTGNATYSGSIFQSSDARLKTNVLSLDASSSLATIEVLNPVSYTRIDQDDGQNLGFIAQQVQQIFPQLVSTTSATALTPDGTLTLNYVGLIAPIVSAIQALYTDVQILEQTVAAFAQSFTSNTITATNELCVSNGPNDPSPICVTKSQLAALLAAEDQQSPSSAPTSNNTVASTTPDSPPIIIINGDNPAAIQVGDGYADLGATVIDIGPGQAGDANLGYKTFLNGALVSNIVIDTSEIATDTIDYVATDTDGLTATSTRTVIIEAAATSTGQ